MRIFAVVFGNYSPYEIDSLWEIETDANRRADELKVQWRVIQFTVNAAQHGVQPDVAHAQQSGVNAEDDHSVESPRG